MWWKILFPAGLFGYSCVAKAAFDIEAKLRMYRLHSRRFPVEELPDDEQECANWLHKLYQEKVSWLWKHQYPTVRFIYEPYYVLFLTFPQLYQGTYVSSLQLFSERCTVYFLS